MEENVKKQVLLGVIVVCLVGAGAITFLTMRKGDVVPDYLAKEMTWVLCRNPACEHSWEITKKQYHVHVEKNHDWQTPEAPPLTCQKCGEPSVYRAVKCEKCSLVFEMGSIPRDYNDRCPKCKYSTLEARREEKRAAAQGG